MRQMLVVLMLTAALAAGGPLAIAEKLAPIPDPLLASLIEEALSKNPDVSAAREALAAAQALPAQARSLPNPMASVVYTNDGVSPSLGSRDMTTLAFMGSQDLPFPGKLRLRGEIRTVEAGQFGQQLERTLTAAVKRAYYGLLLARDRIDLSRPATSPLETPGRLALRPLEGDFESLAKWVSNISPRAALRREAEAGLEVSRAQFDLARADVHYFQPYAVQQAEAQPGQTGCGATGADPNLSKRDQLDQAPPPARCAGGRTTSHPRTASSLPP